MVKIEMDLNKMSRAELWELFDECIRVLKQNNFSLPIKIDNVSEKITRKYQKSGKYKKDKETMITEPAKITKLDKPAKITHDSRALELAMKEGIQFNEAYKKLFHTNASGQSKKKYSKFKNAKDDPAYAEKLAKEEEYMRHAREQTE